MFTIYDYEKSNVLSFKIQANVNNSMMPIYDLE